MKVFVSIIAIKYVILFVMRENLLILLFIAHICLINVSSFTLPSFGNIVIARSSQELRDALNYFKDQLFTDKQNRRIEPLIVAFASENFKDDSYLALYLGQAIKIFDNLPDFDNKTVFYLLYEGDQPVTEKTMIDTSLRLLNNLPKKSIFVSYEHGAGFGIYNLAVYKNITARQQKEGGNEKQSQGFQHNIGPSIIYHVNHERPWEFIDKDSPDYTFTSLEELLAAYSKFPQVIRNYYYAPLAQHSEYFPVGSPFFGEIIGNKNSEIMKAKKPLSMRSKFCFFIGRSKYDMLKNNFDEIITINAHAQERIDFFDLARNGTFADCEILEYTPNFEDRGGHYSRYSAYIRNVADTIFAPCPAGNNPETFRIYESLDLGAIPIIVHPTNDEINFLNFGLWTEYPGPILKNWNELDNFFANLDRSASNLDSLQSKVQHWYERFQNKARQALSKTLLDTFDSIEKESSHDDGSDNASVDGNDNIEALGDMLNDENNNDSLKMKYDKLAQSMKSMVRYISNLEDRMRKLEANTENSCTATTTSIQ